MIPKAAGGALAGVLVAASPAVAADRGSSDGAYGRLHGDLAVQLDAGPALAGRRGAAFASLCARYLQTAGLCAAWLDGFADQQGPAARSLSLGVELRPLFLPRLALDLERGPAPLDLGLDSLALRIGGVVSAAHGYSPAAPGFEAGLAWGLPLQPRAQGLWLDLFAAVRVSHPALAGDTSRPPDHTLVLSLTLGWQVFADAHIVDARDRLVR
jgi:hypothetical protein